MCPRRHTHKRHTLIYYELLLFFLLLTHKQKYVRCTYMHYVFFSLSSRFSRFVCVFSSSSYCFVVLALNFWASILNNNMFIFLLLLSVGRSFGRSVVSLLRRSFWFLLFFFSFTLCRLILLQRSRELNLFF